jgi:hypothetical protein
MSDFEITKIEEKDLKTVIGIQKELFSADLVEDISILRRKCELFPEGCWIIKKDGNIIGYLLSHPWILYSPPANGIHIESLPQSPNCIHFHDIGILTRIVGKGIGRKIVMKFIQFAMEKGYKTISAVSVMGTLNYWKKYGFVETSLCPERYQELIQHYGNGAYYITLDL